MSGVETFAIDPDTLERVCAREGCGSPLPSANPRRKWCSGRCRRQASHDRTRPPCIDCGGVTSYSGMNSSRCWSCEVAARAAAHHAQAEDVVSMWADGMTGREIAKALGWASGKRALVRISELRAEGYDLPFRRPDMVEHMRVVGNRKRAA